jgi:hypothetical protein
MRKRALLTALAALGTLGFTASAQAAYLTLGTTNTSTSTTALNGNSAGSELLVKNSNGSSASAFGVYGLLTATSPTVNATAVRGQNSSTNARGYGVYGSQGGSGTGVRGFAPSGKGVWGSSTSGIGVLAQHTATTGTNPALSASTNSTADNASALLATVTPTSPGVKSAAVNGINNGTGSNGIGVSGSQAGDGVGVFGTSATGSGVRGVSSGYAGVYGLNTGSGPGLYAYSTNGRGVEASGITDGVNATGGTAGVSGGGSTYGVYGESGSYGVFGKGSIAVEGNGTTYGVFGSSGNGTGVEGKSSNADGIVATSDSSTASGIYAEETGASGRAGWFQGNVLINGTCTGCTGPSALQIDDPLDPAHKYLQHSSVASSQQLDVYSGNATTNGKGFATVRMPKWFEALNRSFRYQLTIVGSRGWNARVVKPMTDNRFTIQSGQAHVKVSWQVTAVRHDRYAKANPTQVIVPKSKADQGKYVHPELYGKPKTEGIGYRKPPRAPRTTIHKR